MLVAVITTDKPGALQTRLDNRDAHLAYIQDTGCVAMAGPFLDDSDTMCGSMIVLDVDSMDDARTWAENDPYAQAGLFSDVRIQQWKKVIG
jgi:uncharacterized protein YciI